MRFAYSLFDWGFIMEKLNPLGGNIKIYSNDDYRFGTDGILLSAFSAPKRHDRVIDLGSGGGIIPLLWCRKPREGETYALEIQKAACDLMKKSVEVSQVSDKIKILNMDMKEIETLKMGGRFDLVTCNPPYRVCGGGILNESDARMIARHEVMCDISDVCTAAAHLLKTGGRVCICSRPERLSDVICALRECGCEPKKLRFVAARCGAEPWLFLVEGKRGASRGMRVLPTLYMEENGEVSAEIKEIYGM